MDEISLNVYIFAALVAAASGSIGWIIRSLFDVFYVERSKRRSVSNAIAAEIYSIEFAYKELKQREYINAIAQADESRLIELRDYASVQAGEVNTNLLDRFGSDLYLLPLDLLNDVFEIYRILVILRLQFSRIEQLLAQEKVDEAQALARRFLLLADPASTKAPKLIERLRKA
jgi:hypothetical protein